MRVPWKTAHSVRSKKIKFKLYLKIHRVKHTRFAVWHVYKHVARGKILCVTPVYVITFTSVPHAWPWFLIGGLVKVPPMMIIDLHSSDDACSSSKSCSSCKSVKQTNMPVPYFAYDVCTVLIMHSIFLVLSFFVLRRLVNNCVISDIVHFM